MATRTHRIGSLLAAVFLLWWIGGDSTGAFGQGYEGDRGEMQLPGWKTNTAKRSIELYELESGGPGKDGIPALENPRFVKPRAAKKWLKPVEPVISVVVNRKARAYPLQILIWHEIINDRIGDVPILVTFCPLCYSANVYDRRVNNEEVTFGVSGMLRHMNLVMYDRKTESLWQQVTGEAIVGDMVGAELKSVAAQIISFDQFLSVYHDGLVLLRETGYERNYGRNPYVGYDHVSRRSFASRSQTDDRLSPMEKVIAVNIKNTSKAYPYRISRKKHVINDIVGGKQIAVFHDDGAVSALDRSYIAKSREVGSTGVFGREVDGKVLKFRYNNGTFTDKQTGTTWSITGEALQGPLKGKRLSPITHGDYFAFIWLVFKPETEIHK